MFPKTLRERLVDAEYVPDSLASVAGLDYGAAQSTGEFLRLGDSQGLIPPITGNGMSLAFESAALALGPLRSWSLGQLGWDTACHEIQLRLRSRFGSRLWRARHLQSFLLNPLWARLQSSLVPLYPVLVPLAFRGTR